MDNGIHAPPTMKIRQTMLRVDRQRLIGLAGLAIGLNQHHQRRAHVRKRSRAYANALILGLSVLSAEGILLKEASDREGGDGVDRLHSVRLPPMRQRVDLPCQL